MISTSLLVELFNTNCIQRWNDKLRPVDLVELDYQGHRMMIAYFLAKFEERKKGFQWTEVIEGGIFDLLETSVLTDLRWNVKEALKRNPERRSRLKQYVKDQLEPLVSELNHSLFARFKRHQDSSGRIGLAEKLLRAAGAHAREWEFHLLEQTNPYGYEIQEIRSGLDKEKKKHNLRGCNQLHVTKKYRHFVDVCGELRFQGRWSHLHMSPRTSVLGHSMFVATVSYLFSLAAGACERQRINNFWLGLFHDLAETQTRDVRSPLKSKLPVIGETLEEISKEMVEKEIIQLLPPSWQNEFRVLTLTEPGIDFATVDDQRISVRPEEVLNQYNSNAFDPMSGSLVKAADNLSAFLEAEQAVRNGCGSPEVQAARYSIAKLYEDVKFNGLDLGLIYRELST